MHLYPEKPAVCIPLSWAVSYYSKLLSLLEAMPESLKTEKRKNNSFGDCLPDRHVPPPLHTRNDIKSCCYFQLQSALTGEVLSQLQNQFATYQLQDQTQLRKPQSVATAEAPDTTASAEH